jgi:polysaccharide export outer membrane protein
MRTNLLLKAQVLCFSLLAVLFCSSLLRAQNPAPANSSSPAPAASGSAALQDLRIAAGDVMHVLVFDTPELEQHARVDDTGSVKLQLIGLLHVGGLTSAEAATAIQSRLIEGGFMVRPEVSVQVEKYEAENVTVIGQARLHVTVIGQARLPGVYSLPTPSTVLEVLALAGGLADAGDRHILIERHGTGQTIPYYYSNESGLAIANQVMVYPGDTVIVPKVSLVYALGDVAHPGGYLMQNNESAQTVLQLVAQAGGTNHTAVPSHARLIRKTAQGFDDIPLSLSDMQKGRKPDMALQKDDIIYVPFSYLRNLFVQASGIFASATSAIIYASR